MVPQPKGCEHFEVASLSQPCVQQVISKLAGLWKAICTTDNFKVDPPFVLKAVEIILIDEFLQNIGKFDVDVLP